MHHQQAMTTVTVKNIVTVNNIITFSYSILKTLQMKKSNSLINSGGAHLKPFPGLKANQYVIMFCTDL